MYAKGPCCACRRESSKLRNLVDMDFEHPHWDRKPQRTVWGCFVCELPGKGAVAFLCDECIDAKEVKILDIVAINSLYPDRLEITEEMRARVFQHDMRFHELVDRGW